MENKNYINVVALSDTHNIYDFENAPAGDLLIIAGDILMSGSIKELRQVMVQLTLQADKWKHILIVPGNHDFALQTFAESPLPWEEWVKDYDVQMYPENMTISHRGFVEVLGLTIFTWSYVPNLPRWAFPMMDGVVYEEFKNTEVPDYVDLVVTHGPPYGKTDWIKGYGHVGSKTMEAVFNFPYNIHIYGHIHEGYGSILRDRDRFILTNDGEEFRKYYNVAVLDEHYKAVNEPIKIKINAREKSIERSDKE